VLCKIPGFSCLSVPMPSYSAVFCHNKI
jgi:hypothetical protein